MHGDCSIINVYGSSFCIQYTYANRLTKKQHLMQYLTHWNVSKVLVGCRMMMDDL